MRNPVLNQPRFNGVIEGFCGHCSVGWLEKAVLPQNIQPQMGGESVSGEPRMPIKHFTSRPQLEYLLQTVDPTVFRCFYCFQCSKYSVRRCLDAKSHSLGGAGAVGSQHLFSSRNSTRRLTPNSRCQLTAIDAAVRYCPTRLGEKPLSIKGPLPLEPLLIASFVVETSPFV